jgi:ADP-ribosylglycohydrolase
MVPLALAFFHIGDGDAMKAMGGAATFGRDCDGIASMAGAITGAWKGIDGLDMEVVNKVDAADRAFYGEAVYDSIEVLAEKMQAAILNTFEEKALAVESLRGLT